MPERKSKYHTDSDYDKASEKKKKTVPAAKITLDLLDDFNSWVSECNDAANAKVRELINAGRNDPVSHKRIVDKVLIGMFRGSKWSP